MIVMRTTESTNTQRRASSGPSLALDCLDVVAMQRNDLLDALDVESVYAQFGVPLERTSTGYSAYCPFHGDSAAGRPNLSVSDGVSEAQPGTFHCFHAACGASGSIIDFVVYMQRTAHTAPLPKPDEQEVAAAFRALEQRVAHDEPRSRHVAGVARAPISPALVDAWASCLHGLHPDVLAFLTGERGISLETIRQHRVGFDEQSRRITIPVMDAAGQIVNVRKYKPHATKRVPKVVSYADGYGDARWIAPLPPPGERVVIFAGELDYLKAVDLGIDGARSMCCGEGTVPWALLPALAGRTVFIWYDNDDAGRAGAQKLAAACSTHDAAVHVVGWPDGFPERHDFSDLCVQHGASIDVCESLLASAPLWLPAAGAVAPALLVEDAPLDVTLAEASRDVYANERTRLRVRGFVTGRDSYPYLAPYMVEYRCPTGDDGRKPCATCPLQPLGGRQTLQLTGKHEQLMRTIGCSDTQQIAALKEVVGLPPLCRSVRVVVQSRQNVELVRVSPPLDARRGVVYDPVALEQEHVQRFSYVRNRLGILANRGYTFHGYTGAAKDQQVAHIWDTAEPLDDDAAQFTLTPALYDALAAAFQPQPTQTVGEKWAVLYADLTRNVHEVYGRSELQTAADLVAHSVAYGLYFRGRYINRSWVQALVVGDTGQGKTTLVESLHQHYRAGALHTCEGMRRTGLFGSCVQIGTNWRIQWGVFCRHDMDWLTSDELHALPEDALVELSTARSSGVAEISKVAGGRTRARTRWLCLANPRDSKSLESFAFGVQAIADVVHEPADIRRFDFALTMASGEVPTGVLNAEYHPPVTHTHTSDLCHSLLLWAWSRRANQVLFSREAESLCLTYAEGMGEAYTSSIPLVESGDQRLKLARLAASAAARVFSTNATQTGDWLPGSLLIVQPEHVEFVYHYLREMYRKPSMAYDEYSLRQRATSALSPQTAADIAQELRAFKIVGKSEHGSWRTLVDTLRSFGASFLFRQLRETLGLDEARAFDLMGVFIRYNLIQHSHHGYRKTPRFITWLRQASEEEPV